MIVLYCLLYALAGFFQEILITSYHRSVISERNLLASTLSSLITVVSLLIVTFIVRKILDPTVGIINTVIFVFIFAVGKGFGAYGSLSWWSRKKGICNGEGNCQRVR